MTARSRSMPRARMWRWIIWPSCAGAGDISRRIRASQPCRAPIKPCSTDKTATGSPRIWPSCWPHLVLLDAHGEHRHRRRRKSRMCQHGPSCRLSCSSVRAAGGASCRRPRHLADAHRALCLHPRQNRGVYSGQWYNLREIDGSLNGNPLIVSLTGNTLTMRPVRTPGTFTGTVSADGKTISGDWGAHDPMPLSFERATPANAHAIDPSPHKVQFVTVAPDVKLEVLDFGG